MRKLFSVLIIVLSILFVYAPIILLFIYSFSTTKIIGSEFGEFSFDLYLHLFTETELSSMIIDTIVLALLSSVIATILGTIGALGIFYNKKWLGRFTKSANRIPIINAEIVTAISLALVFALFNLGQNYISLLIGHVVISIPFVVLSVLPKLQQMDGSLYEAALDLGASPFKALIKVVIPEIMPGIFAGFLLAITLSLDDYMVSCYLKPPEMETISTYVFGALKKPKNSFLPELRALSSIIFFIMIIIVLILNFKKSKNTNTQKI